MPKPGRIASGKTSLDKSVLFLTNRGSTICVNTIYYFFCAQMLPFWILLYHIGRSIFYPFEFVWTLLFGIPINARFFSRKKIVILGVAGGDGKTTLANSIVDVVEKFGASLTPIDLDKCKYVILCALCSFAYCHPLTKV